MINILVLRELVRLAPNSKYGNIFIHAWFFSIRTRMFFSFSLRSINAPMNRILISTLAFLYSFSDQDRMKRDYKLRECLTAILIGARSMNLWLVWKVFFFYYFVFLLLLSRMWIPVTYFATLLSWQVYILCRLCLLMRISLAREKMRSIYHEFVLLINLSGGWGYSAFKQQEPGVSITTSAY